MVAVKEKKFGWNARILYTYSPADEEPRSAWSLKSADPAKLDAHVMAAVKGNLYIQTSF
jgi:hypothetical protein